MIRIPAIINYIGSRKITSGAIAIIKNSKGEILLGKREKNHLIYSDMWGIPGGLIDYGETSEKAVIREIEEEVGVQIKIIKKGGVYEKIPTKKFKFQTITFVYYGKIISGIPEPKDETSEVKWFKPNELKKMKLAYNQEEILEKEGII